MSTLDKIWKKQNSLKLVLHYLYASIFCLLFSVVYEHFSHGVYSDYMIYLCLFPLLGGVLPFLLISLIKPLLFPGKLPRTFYHLGLITLTVGSCLSGIMEIYGTATDYIIYYWIMGTVLGVFGIVFYLFSVYHYYHHQGRDSLPE
ncbi:MAG: hypothetical protein VB012_00430 [Erysipelotrichaceae bacterium]|nr:hypothetical protein [Erysipelotrichaceae bacterium]